MRSTSIVKSAMTDLSAKSASRATLDWIDNASLAKTDLGRSVNSAQLVGALCVQKDTLLATDSVKSAVSSPTARNRIASKEAVYCVRMATTLMRVSARLAAVPLLAAANVNQLISAPYVLATIFMLTKAFASVEKKDETNTLTN
jgi:hypothetical protein